MFVSGFIAERVNLRYFLSLGMILSGFFTYLFGLAYSRNIHNLSYFILVQVIQLVSFVKLCLVFTIISTFTITVYAFLGSWWSSPNDRLAWGSYRRGQLVWKGKAWPYFRLMELSHLTRKHFGLLDRGIISRDELGTLLHRSWRGDWGGRISNFSPPCPQTTTRSLQLARPPRVG